MKILLADDEPIARTMLEHWLTGWGYNVLTVSDGERALSALKADPELKLALLDWVMPKLDGVGVCRALRSGGEAEYKYIVLLTARDSKASIVEGLDAGADDYIIKPCNPLELKVRLRAGRRVVDLQEQLVAARDAFRYEAQHDALTETLNRRAMMEQLDRELSRTKRNGSSVAVLMGDLDHFKVINDTHGHDIGDLVLKEVARRMKQVVRPYDLVARFGGEEFVIGLPECSFAMAFGVAHRLEAVIRQTPVMTPVGPIPVSISLGVAATDQLPEIGVRQLLRGADAAMYRAKRAGRARAMLATPVELAHRSSGELAAVVVAPASAPLG